MELCRLKPFAKKGNGLNMNRLLIIRNKRLTVICVFKLKRFHAGSTSGAVLEWSESLDNLYAKRCNSSHFRRFNNFISQIDG